MKPRRFWTPEEDAILRELYPNNATRIVSEAVGWPIGSVHDRASRLGIRRNIEWIRHNSSVNSKRNNKGKFKPGQKPWNTGLKGCQGYSHTRFTPGNRPHNWVPLGSERITKDGYLERKVRDEPGHGNFERVHVLVWEAEHGPVPTDHVVVFLNKDKADVRIENLELISRAENLRRNSVQRFPEDLRKTMAVKAWVTRIINERSKNEESHG